MPVIVLLADGLRRDVLAGALASGALPALSRIATEGSTHSLTTVFPSVTGPAYTPFLTGRYPGSAGIPGIRWYDRARERGSWPSRARSYVGHEVRHADGDLDAEATTIFELEPRSIASLSMLNRGLATENRIGHTWRDMIRGAWTHFRGDVGSWLDADRDVAGRIASTVRRTRPRFVFAALMGIDKVSHAERHTSPRVVEALRTVDDLVAELRHDAERAGVWEHTKLWLASDHGHVPVEEHDDLADVLRAHEFRVLAHPRIFTRHPEVAVMVSGNAMAQLYVNPRERARLPWPELTKRWEPLADLLLSRNSVDLLALPSGPGRCQLRARGRGTAELRRDGEGRCARYSYVPVDGDPLGLGELRALDDIDAHDATMQSDYPDALVQLISLSDAPRSGDLMVSAARHADFRARYEPIPHRSSHGALHRDHMLVPLIVNRPITGTPRRTADVFSSALESLNLALPDGVDGKSFL